MSVLSASRFKSAVAVDDDVRSLTTGRAIIGISGARQNAAAALAVDGELIAFCEQERATRIRRIALDRGELPHEALSLVLQAAGRSKTDVHAYVTAEEAALLPVGVARCRIDHHFAHAAAAAFTSPFQDAAVLVCDQRSSPSVSVWTAQGGRLFQEPWPWEGVGFASVYSAAAEAFGFHSGQEHQLEVLARLDDGAEADRFTPYLAVVDGGLKVQPGWRAFLADWLEDSNGGSSRHAALVASSFQAHLGRLLLNLVGDIRAVVASENLCLGGGLFYNTYFNTLIRDSGIFEHVFVPPNPGNPSVAAGAALAVSSSAERRLSGQVSPFLGPMYDMEEIKATLDNCKLTYACLSEGEVVGAVVDALMRGRLVGWFQGRMEWGHRALGNRSILASPLSPYSLENLNVFLKKRPLHWAYGVSVCAEDLQTLFGESAKSDYMEFEYRPVDPERLRHALPEGARSLRVQTVGATSARFRALHKAFAAATGCGALVNTSFNGFSEPIVCSPRDAIRVFFGTGLDMLVLDRFVIQK